MIWGEIMKKHIITEEEYNAVKILSKKNKNKNIDRRLQVIILRFEGVKDGEIAMKLCYHRKRISQLCAEFKNVGIEQYSRGKFGGNHRSLSFDWEKENSCGRPSWIYGALLEKVRGKN